MPEISDTPAQPADRIEGLHALMAELEMVLQTVVLNDSTIIDGLVQLLGMMQQMQLRTEQSLDRLSGEIRSLAVRIEPPAGTTEAARGASVPSGCNDFVRTDPEVDLLVELHAYIANPVAIDVGANVGDVSARLLQAGYEVFAFEPYAPAFESLMKRLGGMANFSAYQLAIGAEDGAAALHLAADLSSTGTWNTTLFNSLVEHPMLDDLRFTQQVPVTVRSLASLAADGSIPASAGVLKIDTEGLDLAVLRGLGDGIFTVVVAEFWDSRHPFGRAGHGRLADLVAAMHGRGYRWHLVIYRLDEKRELSFLANRDVPPANAWGNALFFQDHVLFARALAWCQRYLVAPE